MASGSIKMCHSEQSRKMNPEKRKIIFDLLIDGWAVYRAVHKYSSELTTPVIDENGVAEIMIVRDGDIVLNVFQCINNHCLIIKYKDLHQRQIYLVLSLFEECGWHECHCDLSESNT